MILEWHAANIIGEEKIRRMPVRMLVDTGSEYMCINEITREQLGLAFREKRKFQMADGTLAEYDIVGPIDVRFSNRMCATSAVVLPGDNEMLLGAITMEDMDVVINPQRRELTVNPEHPYVAQMKLKQYKVFAGE
jgi:clan AA aspartic protease